MKVIKNQNIGNSELKHWFIIIWEEEEALKIAKQGLKQAKKSDAPDGLNTLSLLVDRLSNCEIKNC